MSKRLRIHETNGKVHTVIVSDSVYNSLNDTIQHCFYTKDGGFRDVPVGRIQIMAENDQVIFDKNASDIMPFMTVEEVEL
jgi:hypothetical protein